MPDPQSPVVPRLWRGESPATERDARRAAARRRLFAIQAAILALAGAAVGMLFWLKPVPDPDFLPVWLAGEPPGPVPAIPWAEQDLKAMEEGRAFSRILGPGFTMREGRGLAGDLEALGRLGSTDSVVVYLSANARSGEGGRVFLLPADADLGDPRTWLPLADVLKGMAECRAARKLLILDIMRPLAGPTSGVLADDVADRIPDELEALGAEGRPTVLCACGPGQVALASEDLRRSAFAYYLEEGLLGRADREARGDGDGQVSVGELAAFVRSRVGRWAALNRGARQTPVLYARSPGDDFPLAMVRRGRLKPREGLPEPRSYPRTLLDAWGLRDRWLAEGGDRVAPRVVRRLEADLLAAEAEWREGRAPARIREDRIAAIEDLRRQYDEARAVPRPEPRSIGLAVGLGARPDESLADALKEAFRSDEAAKPEEAETARAKKVAEFLEKARGASEFQLARAVWSAATADARPDPAKVRALDALLRARQPDPIYVETLALRRLAERASRPADGWPVDAVRRALDAVDRGERAQGRPGPFPWVRPLLDEAAQARHDGEVALGSPGFVPPGLADRLLKQAGDAYDAILADEDTIQGARLLRDDAMAFLTASLPYQGTFPRSAGPWTEAVRAAREVDEALAPPPDAAEYRPRLDDLRRKAEALRALLDGLRQPFRPSRIDHLIAQSRRTDADASTGREIDALLATPIPRAKDREALWTAGRGLARRLLEKTLALDRRAGDVGGEASGASTVEDPGRDSHEAAVRRAGASLALLELAGLPPGALRKLGEGLSRVVGSKDAAARDALGRDLRRAWVEGLSAQVEPQDLAGLDRLARVLPATIASAALDDPRANPTARLRAREDAALRSWLGDRYEYETRDVESSELYALASREYRDPDRADATPFVQFVGDLDVPRLTSSRPSATPSLRLRLRGPAAIRPEIDVRVVEPDDSWLEVRPIVLGVPRWRLVEAEGGGPPSLAMPAGSPDLPAVPIRIALNPDGDRSGTPPPRGILIQARVAGRTYSRRVPLSLRPAGEELQILLGPDPKEPTTPLGELRLRPAKGARQPFFLYARNPTERPRKLVAELRAGESVLTADLTKAPLDAHETRKLVFGDPAAPPPKPDAPLPDLSGPLQVALRDADDRGAVVQERTIAVAIASPSEYVRVTDVRFDPPGPKVKKNRLAVTLEAASRIADPPCVVELVLPPGRIPGLIAAKDGTFRGALPPPGQPLELFAEDIRLAEAADEPGEFVLDIDGVPRAMTFRATFARRGETTTPRREARPALRLRADDAARPGSRYEVVVEVDNAPDDASLEIELGHSEAGAFRPDRTERFAEARRRRVGFSATGPGGALLFEASDEDRTIAMETAGLRGRRDLVARLKFGAGRVLTASRPVVLDDAAPGSVHFVDPPPRARKGSSPRFVAVGAPTGSGIKSVAFFVGKADGGKLPPGAVLVPAAPVPGDPSAWTAAVPLPAEKAGPVDVGVQFVNGVGLSTFDSTTVELLDADPVPPTRISGKVTEGPRPQSGIDVLLLDEKNVIQDRTKADDDGVYSFSGLKPGRYKVYAGKIGSATHDLKPVDLKPGDQAKVDLGLRR